MNIFNGNTDKLPSLGMYNDISEILSYNGNTIL